MAKKNWSSKLKDAAPALVFDEAELKKWGYQWRVGTKNASGKKVCVLSADEADVPAEVLALIEEDKYPSAFTKKQGMDFGIQFDRAVGAACADMLGDVPIVDHVELSAKAKAEKAAKKKTKTQSRLKQKIELAWVADSLVPPHPNCIEVGPARVIGGVRPQNFDVAYRPDGPRIVYDSKTLNDAESIPKNWQNMVNDLGTEATTVHIRFPYAVVAFIVAVPKPAIRDRQTTDLIRTLERLGTRTDVDQPAHLAEAISFVVWDPETGKIDQSMLTADSNLRQERFMDTLYERYVSRYKGLPPHDA